MCDKINLVYSPQDRCYSKFLFNSNLGENLNFEVDQSLCCGSDALACLCLGVYPLEKKVFFLNSQCPSSLTLKLQIVM